MPIVEGKELINRNFILFEHLWDFEHIPQSECVRSDHYKLIRYPQHPGYDEFYDLRLDPLEVRNLIQDPDKQPLIGEYRLRLDSLIAIHIPVGQVPD